MHAENDLLSTPLPIPYPSPMIVELTPEEKNRLIDGYEHLHAILKRFLLYEGEIGSDREHFWMIGYQSLDYEKYVELVAIGQLNVVAMLLREAYRMAVHQGCNRVIMAHNHSNGDLKFSRADSEVTKRMVMAERSLGFRCSITWLFPILHP